MKLTMIMNTTGHHPHLIAKAIGSALNQNNKDFVLKIFCIHPDGLHLDKEYPNVKIFNIKPFKKFPLQIAYAISKVVTDYWCILDSDDYILPHHTEVLLTGIEDITLSNIIDKHGIGCEHFYWYEKGQLKKDVSGGWWRFAFTGFPQSHMDLLAKGHKTQNGFDSVLFQRIPCKILLNTDPSYVYRRGESWHVSNRGIRPNFEKLPVITPEVDNDLLCLLH